MIQQTIPVTEHTSLSSDAPGYSASNVQGPICWKCKGLKEVKDKKKTRSLCWEAQQKKKYQTFTTPNETINNNNNNTQSATEIINGERNIHLIVAHKICPVCHGVGSLPRKKKEMENENAPGQITRRRKVGSNFDSYLGPAPNGACFIKEVLMNSHNYDDILSKTLYTIYQQIGPVNHSHPFQDINLTHELRQRLIRRYFHENDDCWLPKESEQLCNLVGQWRILQRVGSHRWTTDDIVTAYVAGKIITNNHQTNQRMTIKYADLGCGNGSVLQMTSWKLFECFNNSIFSIIGIEARDEALQLARRSVSYNIDTSKHNVEIRRGDFRSLYLDGPDKLLPEFYTDSLNKSEEGFDLVTGTPPYFLVDFTVSQQQAVVESAVIKQGGMPSCLQSAPARCEFRGGVEAYCKAAACIMKKRGYFVVCENWLNNSRVYSGASEAKLHVVSVLPVVGTTRKNVPLFAVYTLRPIDYYKDCLADNNNDVDHIPQTIIEDHVQVRDLDGNWTAVYSDIMKSMSIPTNSN